MSIASIIVLLQLGVIIFGAIIGGALFAEIKTDPAGEWAWVIILTPVLIVEIVLIIFWTHTLSGQMQYWIREHPLSGFFVLFWLWVPYHFILESRVRGYERILHGMRKLLK